MDFVYSDWKEGEIWEESVWNGRGNFCSFRIGQDSPILSRKGAEGGCKREKERKNVWEMEGEEEKLQGKEEKKREEAAVKWGEEEMEWEKNEWVKNEKKKMPKKEREWKKEEDSVINIVTE
jgi:hypothetical protein